MSHVSTYAQKVQNINLFCEVAKSKGYEVMQGKQSVTLYGSNKVFAAAAVKIDGWRYPLAIAEDGGINYDHFGSAPNTMHLLGELCQDYNEQHITQNIPMDVVQNYYTEKLSNGDRKIVLEYE